MKANCVSGLLVLGLLLNTAILSSAFAAVATTAPPATNGTPNGPIGEQIKNFNDMFGEPLHDLPTKVSDEIFHLIGDAQFGFGFGAASEVTIAPTRKVFENPKSRQVSDGRYTILDQFRLKLNFEFPLKRYLGYGTRTGVTVSHFHQTNNLKTLAPVMNPVPTGAAPTELTAAEQKMVEDEENWWEEFRRDKNFGFGYVFKGIEWTFENIASLFWWRGDLDKARYANRLDPLRLAFQINFHSKEIMKDKYQIGDVISVTGFGRLFFGAFTKFAAINPIEFGAEGFIDGLFRYTILKRPNGLVSVKVQKEGDRGYNLGESRTRYRIGGGIIKSLSAGLGITPIAFSFGERSKLKAFESVWTFDMKTPEGRRAYDMAIRGMLNGVHRMHEDKVPGITFGFDKETHRQQTGGRRFRFNIIILAVEGSETVQNSQIEYFLTPDAKCLEAAQAKFSVRSQNAEAPDDFRDASRACYPRAYQLSTDINLKAGYENRWKGQDYSKNITVSVNAVTDQTFHVATGMRLSTSYWVTNQRTQENTLKGDLAFIENFKMPGLKMPSPTEKDWGGSTILQTTVDFSHKALLQIAASSSDQVWALFGYHANVQAENKDPRLSSANWGTVESRKKWLADVTQLELARNGPAGAKCQSTHWGGIATVQNVLFPCRKTGGHL